MKRLRYISPILILLFSILIIFSRCDRDLEEPIFEVTSVVGSAGGTVEVTDQSSRLYGVKLEIPSGTLRNNNNITISIDNNPLTIPQDAQLLSEVVSFTAEDSVFNGFVKITIPFKATGIDANLARVFCWNKELSSWDLTFLDKIEITLNKITIYTSHFSSYAVLFYPYNYNIDKIIDFQPSIDGFSIKNLYDHCYGMASFAKWFKETKKKEVGGLFGWQIIGQQGIAAKAHHFNSSYNSTAALKTNIDAQPDINTAYSLYEGLAITNTPKMLGLRLTDSNNSSSEYLYHAILVIGFMSRPTNNLEFLVYDPNSPGETKHLIFNGTRFLDYYIADNLKVNKIYLISDGMYNRSYMEEVFRVYSFGFLPFNYQPKPDNSIYNIEVAGVLGISRTVFSGAEYEVFGEYNLNSPAGSPVIVPFCTGTSLNNTMVAHKASGYFSVALLVKTVEKGFEKQLGIGFFQPAGSGTFTGTGFGGGTIILPD